MLDDHAVRIREELRRRRPRSEEAYARACRVLPSGTVSRARILAPFPFFAARGEGSRIHDIDGNTYIDCAMGFGAHLLGHAHPVVVSAIQSSVENGTGYGTPHLGEVRLAELLVEAIPCAGKVTFCNSGSEATLNAIRIARAFTGKPGIAKFEGGYHGWYDAVLANVGFEPAQAGDAADPQLVGHSIGVPSENTAHTCILPFNHDAAFDKIRQLKDRLALVMVEAIQGAGGAIPGDRAFLQELRRVCTETGVLLLVDEVITGFRLARGGAQEHYGIKADLATYSKAVGAGLPLGVIAGTDEVMGVLGTTGDPVRDRHERVFFGGTFNGCVPVMAVGIAVLTYLAEHPETYARLNAMGEAIRQGIRAVATDERCSVTVVGDGSLFITRFVTREVRSHRDLTGENSAAYREFFLYLIRHGVFVPNTHFGLISGAHTDDDVRLIVEAHQRAFRDLRVAGLVPCGS